MGLRERYLGYIDVLNERRFGDLGDFVAEELRYNGRPMTREQYRAERRAEAANIPDLRFEVALLAVDGDLVACKLDFDLTPAGTFMGLEPAGRRIRFSEHVFYRFADGKIVEVVSLIDTAAVARQLSAAQPDTS